MTTIRTFMTLFAYFRLWPFPLFAFTLGARADPKVDIQCGTEETCFNWRQRPQSCTLMFEHNKETSFVENFVVKLFDMTTSL